MNASTQEAEGGVATCKDLLPMVTQLLFFTAHTHCLSMINKESKMAGRGKTMSVSST